MALLRRRELRRDITAVVFRCTPTDLQRFSVATGPCVPLKGGDQPLVSPLLQDGGETPRLTAALYTALTGRPVGKELVLVEKSGPARLSRFSDKFVEAMAVASRESLRLIDEDEARGDENLTGFTQHQEEISAAWMRADNWPRSVVGLQPRLLRLAIARESLECDEPLYVWHGPRVSQFVVVSGRGPYPGSA